MCPGYSVYLRNLLLPTVTRGLAELLGGGGAAASSAPHRCYVKNHIQKEVEDSGIKQPLQHERESWASGGQEMERCKDS